MAIFKKISDGEPILTVVSNVGENVQYRCFTKVCDVKSVSQSDTIALLGNNYCLQTIETWAGFAEQFYASNRMGSAPLCSKISTSTASSETYLCRPHRNGRYED